MKIPVTIGMLIALLSPMHCWADSGRFFKPAGADPVERALSCLARMEEAPGDYHAQRCYVAAMLRLDQIDPMVTKLQELRSKHPKQTLFTYWLYKLALLQDEHEAAKALQHCVGANSADQWCLLAQSEVELGKGTLESSLLIIQRARTLDLDNPILANQEVKIRLALNESVRALDLAKRILERNSESPVARLALSRALVANLIFGDARELITWFADRYPDDAVPHLILAQLLTAVDQTEAGIIALQAAVSSAPRVRGPRVVLAQALVAAGRAQVAIDHYVALIDQSPGDSSYQTLLGEALLQADAPRSALGWADAVLEEEPQNSDALVLRAKSLIGLGTIDAALAIRPFLYADHIDGPRRRVEIANALAHAGRTGRAEAEFTDLIQRHPEHADGWVAYAEWYLQRGLAHRAQTVLRQGLSRLPNLAVLHGSLANTYEQQGSLDNAFTAMSAAVELAPHHADYGDELARLDFLRGNHNGAVSRWEGLIERHPSAERAQRRLAAAYALLERHDDARQHLEGLMLRHPSEVDLKVQLGEARLRSGDERGAITVLQDALNQGATEKRIPLLLALAFADNGRSTEAERMFGRALSGDPTNRALRLSFAAFRESRGNGAGALDLYKAQLARDPNDPDAIAGIRRLMGRKAAARLTNDPQFPAAAGDPELMALAARAGTYQLGELGSVLRDDREVHVDYDGVAQIRHTRSVLIKAPKGVDRYREVSIAFHAHRAPYVVKARSITPDGKVVNVGPTRQRIENPHEGLPLFGDARHLVLEFDQLEPGSVIDYEVVTYRPHPDLGEAWWDSYILGNADPTVRVRYRLVYPKDVPVHVKAPGLGVPQESQNAGFITLLWERGDLPGYRLSGDDMREVPAVYVSSMTEWAMVDAWYERLFTPQTTVTKRVRTLAERLSNGAQTKAAKVEAVYRFVEQNIDYLGIEFGIGAYQPRHSDITLNQGKGDCKDMTALMVALLSAMNIKAYPALVRPKDQGVFVTDHPSPGQFSHVLLFVPGEGRDLWLDATSGMSTLSAVPSALRGRNAFVIDGVGGRMQMIPAGDPSRSGLYERRTVDLNATGGGVMHSRLAFSGDLAGLSRQNLYATTEAGRPAILSAPGYLLGQGYIPETIRITSLEKAREALTVEASLADPDLVPVRLDGALVISRGLDIFTNGLLSGLGQGPVLESARTIERHIVIRVPEGYKFDWDPISIHVEGPIALDVQETRQRGRTELVSRLVFAGDNVNEDGLRSLKQSLRAMRSIFENELVIVPGQRFDQVTFLSEIAQQRPRDTTVLTHLGRALVNAGRPREALVVLEKIDTATASNVESLALQAATYLYLDDRKTAEKVLRRLAELPDVHPNALLTLSSLLREAEKFEDAAGVLRRALEQFPEHWEIAEEYAKTLALLGQKDRSLEIANDLTERNPNNPDAHVCLGDVASMLNERVTAENAYRVALSLAPESPRILNNLAWLLRTDADQRGEAIELAKRAIELQPDMDSAWDTLAELCSLEGRHGEALLAIERAIAISEDSPPSYVERRQLLLKRQRESP